MNNIEVAALALRHEAPELAGAVDAAFDAMDAAKEAASGIDGGPAALAMALDDLDEALTDTFAALSAVEAAAAVASGGAAAESFIDQVLPAAMAQAAHDEAGGRDE